MSAVSVTDHAVVLEVLARAAWALDEAREAEWIAQFAGDAVIERRSRDGSVTRWRAADDGLAAYLRDEADAVAMQDFQTWTSDVVVAAAGADAVHVTSTSLRIGSASGGLSNVILGDALVQDVLVRSEEGWRIRSRTIAALGADLDPLELVPASADGGVADHADAEARAADRIEIEALFADYAWALDTADIEGVLTLFSDDAVMQDPFGRFTGSGPDGVRTFFEGLFARREFAGRVHWVSQMVLTPIAGGYRVDSYALVPAALPTGPVTLHLMAFYRDVVVRERGHWRFRERLVGPRWSREGDGDAAAVTATSRSHPKK